MELKKEEFKSGEFINWFSDLGKDSLGLVGERAYRISQAHNANLLNDKIIIPEGFVINNRAINYIFQKNNLTNAIKNIIENSTDQKCDIVAEKIKKLILTCEIPKEISEEIFEAYETLGLDKTKINDASARDFLSTNEEPVFVAIRNFNEGNVGSSFLNIKGNSNLILTIKKSLASIFDEEIVLNRFLENNYFESLNQLFVVQKMIQSDKSGELYSDDKIKIKAIWGLGVGLGEDGIENDEYLVQRDAKVINKKIGKKKFALTRNSSGNLKAVELKEGYALGQVLDESEIQKLCDAALRFDELFDQKVEFEFAIENDEIYILSIDFNNFSEEFSFEEKSENSEGKNEEKIEEKILVEDEEKRVFEKESDMNKSEKIKDDKMLMEEISPIENLSQTKVELLISSENESSVLNKLAMKKGIIELNEEEIKDLYSKVKEEKIDEMKITFENVLRERIDSLNEAWVILPDFSKLFENNNLFSLSGIKYLLRQKNVLEALLEVIKFINSGSKKVGVLFSSVSSTREVEKFKLVNPDLEFGIIIQTPAAVQSIKDLVKQEISKVIFFGDELAEYFLGIDRFNPDLREYYDNSNDALIYQLEYALRVCSRKNIPTSFYGEAIYNDKMFEFLIKKNVDNILCLPSQAKNIYEKILRFEDIYIKGTDKERRQYEYIKEKERQKKELEDFEKVKYKQIVKNDSLNPLEDLGEETVHEKIKEEKDDNENNSDFDEEEELVEDEVIENLMDANKEEINKNVKLIEEEKQEYLKGLNDKNYEDEFLEESTNGETSQGEKKDTLGIF